MQRIWPGCAGSADGAGWFGRLWKKPGPPDHRQQVGTGNSPQPHGSSLERIRDSCSDDWVKRSSDGGGGVGELFVSVSDETFAVPKPTLHVSRMRSSGY